MSDSDQSQGKEIPSWQQHSASNEATQNPATPSQAEPSESRETSTQTTIEQAKKFLEDADVRDATTDRKIQFLESKGLSNEDIQQLLGVSRNQDASKVESLKEKEAEEIQSQSEPIPQPPQSTKLAVQSSRNIPPIITYPEFLTAPTHPAPLITGHRLLTTLYIFGGISALLYGTSKYLIAPMVSQLTKSRHSLAETAQTNLNRFLDRLSILVSEIPPTISHQGYLDNPESESDGDPTELFHRDIGVQTSLPSSPGPSYQATPGGAYTPGTPMDGNMSALGRIKSYVEEINDAGTDEEIITTDLTLTIAVLRDYLDGLAYVPPSYSYNAFPSANVDRKEDDEIARVKASIRGVKGVLLSARSFPGGRGGSR